VLGSALELCRRADRGAEHLLLVARNTATTRNYDKDFSIFRHCAHPPRPIHRNIYTPMPRGPALGHASTHRVPALRSRADAADGHESPCWLPSWNWGRIPERNLAEKIDSNRAGAV